MKQSMTIKTLISFLFTWLLSFDVLAAVSDCQKAATAFLKHPSEYAYIHLAHNEEQNCWNYFSSSNLNLRRLTNLVEKGNQWAAILLIDNLQKLDGGNLEDSLISLGKFSEHRMDKFLIFAKEGFISHNEFRDALTMLPLSISDNQSAQLRVLKKRKKMVLHVWLDTLDEQKALALKEIDAFISEINTKR